MILTGWRLRAAEARIRVQLVRLAWRFAPTFARGVAALRSMEALRRQFMGPGPIRKLVRVNGRHYWDLHSPGWPSAAFDAYHLTELNRLAPFRPGVGQELKAVVLAITQQCAQHCAHCFEWDRLNQPDPLTRADLLALVARVQARGVGQIQLSGGEPLRRYADVLAILQNATPGTDFWLLTAGIGLTTGRARELRAAGLTGVQISLDHHEPALHDFFRGYDGAFRAAEAAVRAALAAGLVVALNLCPTRAFATPANLTAYAELARAWGVQFVHLLEPRAVGHYAGQDVGLSPEQEALLEAFYHRLNTHPAYRAYPIVTYHGWHQRRVGCFGAADRYLYLDPTGDLHACPFCQGSAGSACTDAGLAAGIDRLRAGGCGKFAAAS